MEGCGLTWLVQAVVVATSLQLVCWMLQLFERASKGPPVPTITPQVSYPVPEAVHHLSTRRLGDTGRETGTWTG